jgi:hypothetical protein
MAPDLIFDAPPYGAAESCPSVGDACLEAGRVVEDTCGDPADYDQYSRYVACRLRVLGKTLSKYNGCFSPLDVREFTACVRNGEWGQFEVPERQRRGSKLDFETTPRPPGDGAD